MFYYIGELCRYLLAQPVRPTDTQHSIRVAHGNGLRPQIWKEFQSRFKIPKIAEFYASTEGNVGVINDTDKIGAVGYALFARFFGKFPIRLVKVDPETAIHVKDANGYFIEAGINEPGEVVGLINRTPGRTFDGYNNPKATEDKIRRNVFKPGDAYFLTGDIMTMDEDGFLYFCDRIGDTYRWKGENVSTAEVEGVIGKMFQLRDVVSFGVEIAGMEGKAGMVAIAGDKDAVDLSSLADRLSRALPRYALPLFVRLIASADITGTYKLQKVRLKREGFDLSVVSDPVYFLDPVKRTYVTFSREMMHELSSGTLKV